MKGDQSRKGQPKNLAMLVPFRVVVLTLLPAFFIMFVALAALAAWILSERRWVWLASWVVLALGIWFYVGFVVENFLPRGASADYEPIPIEYSLIDLAFTLFGGAVVLLSISSPLWRSRFRSLLWKANPATAFPVVPPNPGKDRRA